MLVKKSRVFFVFFFCLATCCGQKTQALEKKDSQALASYIVASVHEKMGQIDKAIQEYSRAAKIDRTNPQIHLGLGAAYVKNNNIPKAIEEIDLAAKLDPEAVEPHALLALLYFSQSQLSLAAQEYELALKKASDLEPGNIAIYKNLGLLYLQKKSYPAAERTYKLILSISDNDPEAHFYLANVYDELKRTNEAEKELEKAISLDPDYSQALNYLGYLYAQAGKNLKQAEKLISKALDKEPDNGAYIDSLGWVYFKQGKTKQAIEKLHQAALFLEDPVIYEHLGDAYLKFNDPARARINWEKSQQLGNDTAEVRKKLEALNHNRQ